MVVDTALLAVVINMIAAPIIVVIVDMIAVVHMICVITTHALKITARGTLAVVIKSLHSLKEMHDHVVEVILIQDKKVVQALRVQNIDLDLGNTRNLSL